jgi:hypothetical protein
LALKLRPVGDRVRGAVPFDKPFGCGFISTHKSEEGTSTTLRHAVIGEFGRNREDGVLLAEEIYQ